MITRRTGLMMLFAVVGQMIADDAKAQQLGTGGTSLTRLGQTDLTVSVGGASGFQRFHFTDGHDTITFTAAELMAALKGSA